MSKFEMPKKIRFNETTDQLETASHGEAVADRILGTDERLMQELARRFNCHEQLVVALEYAQRCLGNAIPTAEIDGPYPMPALAAALALAKQQGEG